MNWNDNEKFQQKKKDRSKFDQSENKKTLDVKIYKVVLQENEKMIIVLKNEDVLKIVSDKEGNIYPEQFSELVSKGILKEVII